MACVSRPADASWNRRFDSAVSIMLRLQSCPLCESVRRSRVEGVSRTSTSSCCCCCCCADADEAKESGRFLDWTGLVLVFVHLLSWIPTTRTRRTPV
jgi:hypothetical protein